MGNGGRTQRPGSAVDEVVGAVEGADTHLDAAAGPRDHVRLARPTDAAPVCTPVSSRDGALHVPGTRIAPDDARVVPRAPGDTVKAPCVSRKVRIRPRRRGLRWPGCPCSSLLLGVAGAVATAAVGTTVGSRRPVRATTLRTPRSTAADAATTNRLRRRRASERYRRTPLERAILHGATPAAGSCRRIRPRRRDPAALASRHSPARAHPRRWSNRVGRGCAIARSCGQGLAVDARGDECVVDVADGEDARVEVERVARDAVRVARAVETLVMVTDEAERRLEVHRSRSTRTPFSGDADDVELRIRRCRAQRTSRGCQLPHVVEEPAKGETAQARRGRPSPPHLHRAERDPSRVLFGRDVLVGEGDEQRSHVRPENASSEVTSSTARRSPKSGGTWQSRSRDRRPHRPPARSRRARIRAEPPAEVAVVLDERRHERRRQPDDPDRDQQVAHAPE